MSNPESYSKEQQQAASEPDFYGKWFNVDIMQPQIDFQVICCCHDDVEFCIFREGDNGYWFELPSGKIFEATHWMSPPEPPEINNVNDKNRLVEVCSECGKASCWYGDFMCVGSAHANTEQKTVSELDRANLERKDCYSKETLKKVYGEEAPHGYQN